MGIKRGLDCKAYYGTAGAAADTELVNVTDVNVNLETATADVTTRGGNGWRHTIATLKNGTVEFEMIADDEDLGYVAIEEAYFAGTAISLAFLNGADGAGVSGDFSVTNFSQTQGLEEAVKVSVTVEPTYSTTNQVHWEAAGS